jgi:HSP20 family molecular chaperone IbpA
VFSHLLSRYASPLGVRAPLLERHLMTGLPAKIRLEGGSVRLSMAVLGEAKDLQVFCDEFEVIVEGVAWEDLTYHIEPGTVQERIDRRFARKFHLPWAVDPNAVQVRLEGCVLEIAIRRREAEKSRAAETVTKIPNHSAEGGSTPSSRNARTIGPIAIKSLR